MVCPNPACQSVRLRTTHKRGGESNQVDKIPKRLIGVNMNRRAKLCSNCRQTFYTIEITEDDFEFLRAKTGRLEVASTPIRRTS